MESEYLRRGPKTLLYFIYVLALELQLRALHLLDWCSTICMMLSALFALGILQTGSAFMPSLSESQSSAYSSSVARRTAVCHCLFVYWLRWDLANYLPRPASNYDSPDLCLPSS
jgi:hypothetical protein